MCGGGGEEGGRAVRMPLPAYLIVYFKELELYNRSFSVYDIKYKIEPEKLFFVLDDRRIYGVFYSLGCSSRCQTLKGPVYKFCSSEKDIYDNL